MFLLLFRKIVLKFKICWLYYIIGMKEKNIKIIIIILFSIAGLLTIGGILTAFLLNYNQYKPAQVQILDDGRLTDSKGRHKDGNDFVYALTTGGDIAGVYVED